MRIFATTSSVEVGPGAVPDVSEILPDLWIGRALRSHEDTARLKNELGVTAVVSLETDRDLDAAGLTWRDVSKQYQLKMLSLCSVRSRPAADSRARTP